MLNGAVRLYHPRSHAPRTQRNFSGATGLLSRIELSDVDLRNGSLRGAKMLGLTLVRSNLSGSNLSVADLTESRLSLYECNLTRTHVGDASKFVSNL